MREQARSSFKLRLPPCQGNEYPVKSSRMAARRRVPPWWAQKTNNYRYFGDIRVISLSFRGGGRVPDRPTLRAVYGGSSTPRGAPARSGTPRCGWQVRRSPVRRIRREAGDRTILSRDGAVTRPGSIVDHGPGATPLPGPICSSSGIAIRRRQWETRPGKDPGLQGRYGRLRRSCGGPGERTYGRPGRGNLPRVPASRMAVT